MLIIMHEVGLDYYFIVRIVGSVNAGDKYFYNKNNGFTKIEGGSITTSEFDNMYKFNTHKDAEMFIKNITRNDKIDKMTVNIRNQKINKLGLVDI